MRTATQSHRQLNALGFFPDPLQACRRWLGVHCLHDIMYIEIEMTGSHCLWLKSSLAIPGNSLPLAHKFPQCKAVFMKLTKKQLSVSYVIEATASGPRSIGDVANPGNYRFDRCPMASPQGKVELPAHVSFRKTSRERVRSPYHGLEKHSQLRERHPSCNVEEGPQSVIVRDTCYVNDKAREQWRRSDSGHLR